MRRHAGDTHAMSMITTRTLKAKLYAGGTFRLDELKLLNGNHEKGMWLHSVRLTPEPTSELFIQDIRVGHNSIFASGTGKFKAELLNRFPLTFKVFEVVPPGTQISIHYSGGPYEGLCEIELIQALDGEKFTNKCFMTLRGRTQVSGLVERLIISEKLRSLIESEQVELSLYKAYGEEFAHQIFDEEHVAVRLGPSGRVVIEEPIFMNVSESLNYGIRQGKKHVPLFDETIVTDSDMVAILDHSSTLEAKGHSR